MQLFGSVIHISKDKSLIARCNSVLTLEKAAKLLNKPLFSDKQRKIGEIREIREGERVEVEIKDELIPKFLAKMFERKVFIRDLEIERPGLEEYFLHKANKHE